MPDEKAPNLEDEVATLKKMVNDQAATIQKLSTRKGIQSARKADKPKKVVMNSDQMAERELRRYIVNAGVVMKNGKKQKGRFRKGLPEEKKERARYLMKLLKRKEMKWDESLLDFRNHQPPVTGDDG